MTIKKYFVLVIISVFTLLKFTTLQAQNSKEIDAILKQMKFVKGSAFDMWKLENQFKPKIPQNDTGYLPSVASLRVIVGNYWIGEKEVTNKEWRLFYNAKVAELGKEKAQEYLPDTLIWIRDFAIMYNEPLSKNYFFKPEYDNYPVVGISWVQAIEYCNWLTDYVNQYLIKNGSKELVAAFRLPTEAEWEHAAKAVTNPADRGIRIYPSGKTFLNAKGAYCENFGEIVDEYGMLIKEVDEGYKDKSGRLALFPTPVGSFCPNGIGLYDMGGNVREWVYNVFKVYPFKDSSSTYNNLTNKTISADSAQTSKSGYISFEEVLLSKNPIAIYNRIDKNFRAGELSYVFSEEEKREIIDRDFKHIWRIVKLTYPDVGERYMRVTKGGSWVDPPAYMQCGSRSAFGENDRASFIGFRIALTHPNNDIDKPKITVSK